ncbi:MAG: flavodoxin-dependent (E)-4-hydroxy-3-methylbut-2-enyl-diphosphate synthase [Clostridia bacterium]|jgi:(E)-4-hydroxy-3-methylbut-2-enyl-diphosphate synthase|nr:flavodoxin-dependent (E)-4-hydroxy-3-methylbut-2-enyl-diphosphate synthase [Clostridia bacterium]
MTKKVNVGGVLIGGGESVKIQSMCTTRTGDVEKTAAQISALEKAGCEIIRVSILGEADARALKEIKNSIKIPLVADIHFSADLAVLAIENGADKVRVNPGNIGGESNIKRVADCIKAHKIPVRVGANTGSVEKIYLEKYGKNEFSLVESALSSAQLLEKYGVNDIVISVKASSVPLTVKAYKLLASRTDYPLHIGVTEAGTEEMAVVKSSAALGALLLDGIGDTLRVSITDDPVKEIIAAKRLLRAVGLDKNFVNVISCPTCGRCLWDSMSLAKKVTALTESANKPLKVAVMGCVVNGPGEAKDCDIGIAGAEDYCVIFKNGEIMRKIPVQDAETELLKEISKLLNDR